MVQIEFNYSTEEMEFKKTNPVTINGHQIDYSHIVLLCVEYWDDAKPYTYILKYSCWCTCWPPDSWAKKSWIDPMSMLINLLCFYPFQWNEGQKSLKKPEKRLNDCDVLANNKQASKLLRLRPALNSNLQQELSTGTELGERRRWDLSCKVSFLLREISSHKL